SQSGTAGGGATTKSLSGLRSACPGWGGGRGLGATCGSGNCVGATRGSGSCFDSDRSLGARTQPIRRAPHPIMHRASTFRLKIHRPIVMELLREEIGADGYGLARSRGGGQRGGFQHRARAVGVGGFLVLVLVAGARVALLGDLLVLDFSHEGDH